MTKVELFAYLAAFVSIVLAVALTDMIHSAHRLLRARQQVKWDPLALLLALNVFILLLWNFFGLWGDAQYDRITFNGLLAMITVPTLYTFAAFAVLPDEVPAQGLDLRKFHFDNRRYIVILLALAAFGDLVRSIHYGAARGMLSYPMFWGMLAAAFGSTGIAFLVIYFARGWRIQLVAVLSLLIITYVSSLQLFIETLGSELN